MQAYFGERVYLNQFTIPRFPTEESEISLRKILVTWKATGSRGKCENITSIDSQ